MTDILTAEQVADWLKISEGHLANLRLRGGGPQFTKLGRCVRYRRADVETWINQNLATSTSGAA